MALEAVMYTPPMFREISLGHPANEQEARDAIKKYSGELALIKDDETSTLTKDREYYQLGVIRFDPKDSQCYYFTPIVKSTKIKSLGGGVILVETGKEHEKRLHYDDLEGLLISSLNARD